MTTMTVTRFARSLSSVLDRIEHGGEPVVLVRNSHPVATLIPGAARQNALEALSDICGGIPDAEGAAWAKDMRGFDSRSKGEMKDPWA